MTIQQIAASVNHSADFLKATEPQMFEFRLWKLETDLERIYLNGHWLNVQKLNFLDWIEWRLQDELKQSNMTQDTIDTEFAYQEFESIN